MTSVPPPYLKPKLGRLCEGEPLRVLDLFSGCGGWSCGLDAVNGGGGFRTIGGVERDHKARASHHTNFGRVGPYVSGTDVRERSLLYASLQEAFPGEELDEIVDVVVASPPCQLFSRVGRGKLRSLSEQGRDAEKGREHNLFEDALEIIRDLRPLAVALENVKEYIRFRGQNVAEEVRSRLEGWSSASRADEQPHEVRYSALYGLLNAVWYGIPQIRERVVILGVHESLRVSPRFPQPVTDYRLPSGYVTSRHQTAQLQLLENHAEVITQPARGLPQAPSVGEALADLPVRPGWTESFSEPERPVPYPGPAATEYQRQMREWPGFTASDLVHGHRTRTLMRDYETFARMRPNDGYREAHSIAKRRFQEALQSSESPPDPDTEEWEEMRAAFVPPYPLEKFHDKWRKLSFGLPSHTLTAHLAHDCYSHIHYDSHQGRTITIREAARLQSFPDGFVFEGGMNAAYRQIGNAVPPLMARAVGEVLMACLRDGAGLEPSDA